MSMVYDPVTKEFRPRLAPSAEAKVQAEEQQAAALEHQRHHARRHHQVRRRRLQQDLIFWSILLAVAVLLAGMIYMVNQRIKATVPMTPRISLTDDLLNRDHPPVKQPPR